MKKHKRLQPDFTKSQCCDQLLTTYDKGNGEKYLACYGCWNAVNADGTLKNKPNDRQS